MYIDPVKSGGGVKLLIDNEEYKEKELSLKPGSGNLLLDDVLPQIINKAVEYNDEIHVLGGNSQYNGTAHYKWNGTKWVSVSTLPYVFIDGNAVVYNNEIHILGGSYTATYKYHYKWNGSTWTSVSTLPYNVLNTSSVVFQNKIYLCNNNENSSIILTYNGSSWSELNYGAYFTSGSSLAVYDEKIHIIGSGNSSNLKAHYIFTGTSITSYGNILPIDFTDGEALVYRSRLIIMYNKATLITGESASQKCCFEFLNNKWVLCGVALLNTRSKKCIVIHDDQVHVLGAGYGYGSGSTYLKHYILGTDCYFKQ